MLSTSSGSVRSGVRNEHLEIRAAVEAMEAAIGRLSDREPSAERTDQIVRGLQGLARQLGEHFAREEAPKGILAMALGEAPRLDRRVLAVKRQHVSLGVQLRQVIADAGYAGTAPDAWRGVTGSFHDFAEALRDHERGEDQILADAYLDDLGSGD